MDVFGPISLPSIVILRLSWTGRSWQWALTTADYQLRTICWQFYQQYHLITFFSRGLVHRFLLFKMMPMRNIWNALCLQIWARVLWTRWLRNLKPKGLSTSPRRSSLASVVPHWRSQKPWSMSVFQFTILELVFDYQPNILNQHRRFNLTSSWIWLKTLTCIILGQCPRLRRV
jgi:hypothetical protein